MRRKFPPVMRAMAATALGVLECLIDATYSKARADKLAAANLGVEKMRVSFRLATELRHLDWRRYEHAARSRTSGENLFVVLLVIALSSQELGPPANPGRFKLPSTHWMVSYPAASKDFRRPSRWMTSVLDSRSPVAGTSLRYFTLPLRPQAGFGIAALRA
jgi:hypothetical protein